MIVDAHIHFDSLKAYGQLIKDLEKEKAGQFCILVIDRCSSDPLEFKQAQGIWLKCKAHGRAFLFGGIDWFSILQGDARSMESNVVNQLEGMRRMGFDGLKLLTGKPSMRKLLNLELDHAVFCPMYEWLEATGFPVLWHVSDPAEFWDEETVPVWAKQNRWWYDRTYPSKQQIDSELGRILTAYPKLNLILPHFFFLSGDLENAGEFLHEHPNVHLDLAPGVEWMHNLSRCQEEGKAFLERFADRIIYGSDIGIYNHRTHPDRGACIRRFLETSDQCSIPEDIFMVPTNEPPFQGLKLENSALKKIYSESFYQKVSARAPKPFDLSMIMDYCERWKNTLAIHGCETSESEQIINDISRRTIAAD